MMPYSQLLRYVTPHRRALLTIVGLLLLGTMVTLINPLIAGKLTQTLLSPPPDRSPTVQMIILAWLVLMVIKAVISFFSTFHIGTTGARMAAELRNRVYEHMQILPMAYFHERKQGEVLTLLSHDAEIISRFVTTTIVQLLPLLITFVAAFVIMCLLDPLIALMAAFMLPAYFFITKLLGRNFRPLSNAWTRSQSGMVAFVSENLNLLPVIKAFVREPIESIRFQEKNTELLNITRHQIRLGALIVPMVGLLAGSGSLVLLWVGIRHLDSGQLQPSELVSLIFYILLLTRPLASLAGIYGQIMQTRGAAERLLEFFGELPEPVEENLIPVHEIQGAIEFRQVSFAYSDRKPVFTHLQLDIKAGETVVLTGPNGSGKTTLVHLLMRFFDPDKGSVLIDGQDIRRLETGSLRKQIGLVAQNTLLMNGSVAENIAYGQHLASETQIKKAAIAAGADKFIEDLPDGYQTRIGDQGVKLSGGQRQRLSLARTLLKNPPILILDEATSLFDPESEARFIEMNRETLAPRTVILITHRPASIALADRVINMERLSFDFSNERAVSSV